ncbi:MAG: hypothetical protein M1321_01475, partial [Candidatus Marsarchaeota archaeon]|nr:hypothetical protein [Candidatus Marsarchaeota archaeon]
MAEYAPEQRPKKAVLIKELLHPERPREFGLRWAVNSRKATPESIKASFEYLINIGLSKHKIAVQSALLALDVGKLEKNYRFLRDEMHLTPKKIASRAALLGQNPETIRSNGIFLRDEM